MFGSINWVYRDPKTGMAMIWIKPDGFADFNRNLFSRLDVKNNLRILDLYDYTKVRDGFIEAELHAFFKIKEVKSVYADEDGADHYLAVTRAAFENAGAGIDFPVVFEIIISLSISEFQPLLVFN